MTLLPWRVRPLSSMFRFWFWAQVEIEGEVWLRGTGSIIMGRGVRLRGRRAPIELFAHEGGSILLGDGVVVEAGVSIEATDRVEVGAHAQIGAFCKIMDNHFHHLAGDRAERPRGVPVLIGEHAMVGPRAILLPGTHVEDRGMVGAAEVLSSRRRPEKVVARRPATV